jgi:hypothetical protein
MCLYRQIPLYEGGETRGEGKFFPYNNEYGALANAIIDLS